MTYIHINDDTEQIKNVYIDDYWIDRIHFTSGQLSEIIYSMCDVIKTSLG